jgi:large subunit ribosomal protein L32
VVVPEPRRTDHAGRLARAGLVPFRGAMAVPKKKQSHSRTAKRRANHKIGTPTVNACPQCHSPRRPHRVCPVCGTYAGREIVTPGAHDHDHDHDHD